MNNAKRVRRPHWTRPTRVIIQAYDPFDGRLLIEANLPYTPRLALGRYYTGMAKRIRRAAATDAEIGIRQPRVRVWSLP